MDPELEVVGRHALLFDDDARAAFVNSKEALVEWNSLFIDRYDVRHLLSNPPASFRRLSHTASPPPDSHLESQLDLERYADLPSCSDQPDVEAETEARDAAGFHAVHFSYLESADSTEQKNSESMVETSVFHPPFPVPESLLQNLPPTEKLHQIIARTAMFVSKHGGQSEIVLRVKQGDNPTFGFLMPHHHLHPYFRYLVDHPELLKPDSDGKSLDEKNHDNQTGGALSLLGSVYGSGEDEDGEAEEPKESEQIVSAEPSAASEMSKSHRTEHTAAQKDEIISKNPHSSKGKATALNKNRITTIKPALPFAMKKDGNFRGSASPDIDNSKASGLFPISKTETLIVDPPSEVKRLVDRIVEIILKNGKDFEAVLVEQDKKHGKFPFLLPSNQYHAYYLKVLKKAQESRLSSKSYGSEKDGSSWQELDRRSASVKESDFPSSGSAGHELPLEYDDDRKEKFKMVIGKSKKDSQDQLPKNTQQPAVTMDAAAAAAILQAATRGIKKPNLDIFSKNSLNGASHAWSNEAGRTSSSLQSSQPQNSAQKLNETGKRSVTVPVAKEIAKTAALAAASEADSSEAGLTREQKLKAERLKRAKMFAAMIKSGATPLGKKPLRALSVDPPGSGISGSATNLVSEEVKEREGSSVQAEGLTSDKIEKSKRDSSDGENEQKSRKRRHYRSRKHDSEGEEEDEGEQEKDNDEEKEEGRRHSRKKHRSHHSSRHHRDRSKDRHKHRRKHSSSKSKETRHRHKHESSSEEEDDRHHHRRKHDTSSEDEHRHYKRRHKHDSSSEDEQKHRKRRHKESRKDKHKHHEKSRKEEKSHCEEVELEEGEIRTKSSDQSLSTAGDCADREASVEGSKSSHRGSRTPSLPPPETTEVPDDLRAKIRAMLLATM